MSGRGGGRGGRGGGAARGGSKIKIGGVEIPWDLTGLNVKNTPQEQFPAIPPPQPPPPTADELASVRAYIALRDRIHEGPLYTVLNDGYQAGGGLKRKVTDSCARDPDAVIDPFNATETYSSRFYKKRRTLPKLNTRPYVLRFFPKELHSLIDPGYKSKQANGADGTTKPAKQRLLFDRSKNTMMTRLERIHQLNENGQEDDEDRDPEDEDEYADEDKENEDKDEESDNYSRASTDSEESDDDYNAEQYFDNGDDDFRDDDDGENDENVF